MNWVADATPVVCQGIGGQRSISTRVGNVIHGTRGTAHVDRGNDALSITKRYFRPPAIRAMISAPSKPRKRGRKP